MSSKSPFRTFPVVTEQELEWLIRGRGQVLECVRLHPAMRLDKGDVVHYASWQVELTTTGDGRALNRVICHGFISRKGRSTEDWPDFMATTEVSGDDDNTSIHLSVS